MTRILTFIGILFLHASMVPAEESSRVLLARVSDHETKDTKPMVIEGDAADQTVFVEVSPVITDKEISSAEITGDPQLSIRFTTTTRGAKILKTETGKLIGERLAIVIDGKLISAPVVRESFSAAFQVSGDFDRDWAEKVVKAVNEATAGKKAGD